MKRHTPAAQLKEHASYELPSQRPIFPDLTQALPAISLLPQNCQTFQPSFVTWLNNNIMLAGSRVSTRHVLSFTASWLLNVSQCVSVIRKPLTDQGRLLTHQSYSVGTL